MLSKDQLKGLSINAEHQQNPLIWNLELHSLFDKVSKSNIEFQECDEDFHQFSTKTNNRFKRIKKIRVYHILKSKSKPSQKFMDSLSNVLQEYFSLPVELDPKPFSITPQLKLRDPDGIYQYDIPHRNQQFKAVTMLHALLPYKQSDEVTVGLINYGIHEGKNSISGRAIGNGVTVVDCTTSYTPKSRMQIISTTVHELMHTFGLGHCNYWKCLMNPLTTNEILMCPVCLKKFHFHVKFDIKGRYEGLARVLREAGLVQAARKCQNILKTYPKYQGGNVSKNPV